MGKNGAFFYFVNPTKSKGLQKDFVCLQQVLLWKKQKQITQSSRQEKGGLKMIVTVRIYKQKLLRVNFVQQYLPMSIEAFGQRITAQYSQFLLMWELRGNIGIRIR